jgi:hypothetical protein
MRNLRDLPSTPWLTRNSADAGAGEGAGGGAAGDAGGAGAGGGAGGAGGAGGDAGGGVAQPFYEAFTDANLKTSPVVQRYKTVEELAAGYVSLEKRFGIDPNRRIDLPADPADAKAMREVFEKLGAPKDAEGYGFKLDDKATDADKALVGGYTKVAHELGLSVNQAKGLMEFMDGQVKADAAANTEAMTQRGVEGKAALETEFGKAFEPRLREIRALVTKEGEPELAKALEGDNAYQYPNLVKLLGKVLDRMAEPGSAGGQSGDAAGDDRALTPSQALGAVRALEADPIKGKALLDKTHPQHKAVVEERVRLLAMSEAKSARPPPS